MDKISSRIITRGFGKTLKCFQLSTRKSNQYDLNPTALNASSLELHLLVDSQDNGFHGAQFFERANFLQAQFTKEANYVRAQFIQDANFSGAQFIELAHRNILIHILSMPNPLCSRGGKNSFQPIS
jgi:uncharacterized protein YjbI with pentapeptide repeats